ncbi:MAG: HindIII family type II restriction endonuclease [Planktothrix agardhii KL2]|uniref:HindIII family type II restriction endonuclease n=1 Tax=Planktothrix agardhii TaxID=1160 RepID=UPI001A27B8E6|nr:HindIII family type II restriction endonuclease [Planktothrix agardhii]MBG0745147.1 HindIII family type II restriction endonuclease [Planktothrix agardhii KL2]MCF3624039.1 HindIII family type II restriction endonuclease [Planktothrix agardhii 1801]MCF3646571.1 HindIII family type II restriction endonuclease [Planktothrix agardhii 1026]
MEKLISKIAINRRTQWVEKIQQLSGKFSDYYENLKQDLSDEIKQEGVSALIDHLRLCGNIPELYAHDSSEEKLYAKYTDSLLAEVFKAVGLRSHVITERADAADVEVFATSYSFVADAKSFRLSRTAKNQKDFKIQNMDRWKHGKNYAMVVCPIYQLPNKSSQIYQQSSSVNVCIFTYSHLAMLLRFSLVQKNPNIENIIQEVFKIITTLNPSKNASDYWLAVNKTILDSSQIIENLWKEEKQAAVESINVAKQEALKFLADEREKIMRMTHEEALRELVKVYKIENKIKIINSVTDSKILEIR